MMEDKKWKIHFYSYMYSYKIEGEKKSRTTLFCVIVLVEFYCEISLHENENDCTNYYTE